MRSLFASQLDILGLFAVASLTVSVVIQSFSVLQTASTRATTYSTETSTTHDSPEGFQLMDEFFVPSLSASSLWSLVSNMSNGATASTTEDVTTDHTATRPSFHSILHNETGKVVEGADVSWLLDFAIIGFGKCGTSTVRFV
jgi:nucleoside recognition membrane protein YjiH